MYDLKDKIVLVTGASSGIGATTAKLFAEEGAIVIVHYNSNKTGAENTFNEIKEQGGSGMICRADMKDRLEIDALFSAIFEEYKDLDILINNAGGIGPYADYTEVAFNEVDDVIQTNLIGPMYCSQKALQYFKENNKKGVILSTSSIHDCKVGGEDKALAYCVSKAGLSHMTQILARSAAPLVRVNAISPGPVLTDIWKNDTQETIDYFSERCLIDRRVSPEEIADGFVFLAKNEGMTGTVLYIDGGFRS